MTHNLDSIRSIHHSSVIRLDAAKATHKVIVDKINSWLVAGEIEGVPFRIGEVSEVTGEIYRGRDFLVENIYLKRTKINGRYSVLAVGSVVKMNGDPGTGKASAEIMFPMLDD